MAIPGVRSNAPLARVFVRLGYYIDYRIAGLSALALGAVVYLINSSHGAGPASIAALKQGTYTFLMSGFVAKTCERLATSDRRRRDAILLAILVPSTMAVGFTFILHSIKGTPEPVLSTVPTLLTAPLANTWWAFRKRRQMAEGKLGTRPSEDTH